MKLSELTYDVVKNVVYYEDAGFTYQAFLEKDFDNDQDYANQINNAMTPINEAIHRLSDRNKILFPVVSVGVPQNNLVNIEPFSKKVKTIKAVFYMKPSGYEVVGYNEFNKGFLFIERVEPYQLFVKYVEDIPPFKKEDIYNEDKDVDLKNLNITDTMCDYIIEYAQGKLLEPIAPELANMHITRSEQYFDDLDDQSLVFTQRVVTKKFRI